jgi:beta-1,4-N-acetylglucosaminyltransferase
LSLRRIFRARARHRRLAARVHLLLVCSGGGHLFQLMVLRPAWGSIPRAWVTFDKVDARSLLAEERVYFAFGPTNRNVKNLVRNFALALRLVRELRPRVILTTGAGVAVPFAWVGRFCGARIVYVESVTRIEEPSLTCRLIAPTVDRLYVQWPELEDMIPGARYAGSILSE